MSMSRRAALGLVLCVSCGSPAAKQDVGGPGLGPDGSLPGYVHLLSKSRFPLGTILQTVNQSGMEEVIGEYGVFATQDVSQMVNAIPDESAPSQTEGAFPGGATAQNAAVLAYFTGAGLEADQVSGVTDGYGGGVLSNPEGGGETPLSTIIESDVQRSFAGIPIVDSYASSTFDDKGESVAESVYWPPIAQSTLAAAIAFQDLLGNAASRAAYFSKLPIDGTGGRLVIHHTSGLWTGTFFSAASYDVGQVHFDVNGEAFAIPG